MKSVPRPLDDVTIAHYYTRVSGNEQADEGLSLAQQPERCLDYIGRQVGWVAGDHFQDVLSGRRNDRNEYQRMLLTIRGMALAGKRQSLTVPAFDRLGRNVIERARAYEEFEELGVSLHSIREGGVVPRFIYDVYASVAAEESRQLSVRLREINTGLANRGWHKPGSVAWGYRRRVATNDERAEGAPKTVLEVDEVAAPYVREAWARLAGGESVRSIAGWIATLPDEIRGGRNLGFNAVRKLFRMTVYVGRLGEYDDDEPLGVLDRPLGREPRLIADDVYRAACGSKRMAAKMPRQASGEYLLTGLLRCYRCGSRMSGRVKGTQGGTRGARREYICHAGMVLGASNQTRCLATVKADVLEDAVVETIQEILDVCNRPRIRDMIEDEVSRRLSAEAAAVGRNELPRLEAARKKTRERIAAASVALIDKVLDREAYDLTRERLGAELEKIEAEIGRLRGRRGTEDGLSLGVVLRGIAGWDEAFRTADARRRRGVLGDLLASVEPVKLARGVYEARVVWSAVGQRLFWAAAKLSPSENLVSIDHSGRTRLSTRTMSPTPTSRALAHSA